jgi:hypothetical protein
VDRCTGVKHAASVLLVFFVTLPGCVTTIRPPGDVVDPVEVIVLDYGYHASLAVPEDRGGMVEYAYGEWGWYAESRRGWWRVPGILLLPSTGTLGRRRHDTDADGLAEQVGAEEGLVVQVERSAVDRWRGSMGSAWETGEARLGLVRNPDHGMDFVECGEDYWIFNTCNAAVAGWLEDLGCGISGWTVGASFTLRTPDVPTAWTDTPP